MPPMPGNDDLVQKMAELGRQVRAAVVRARGEGLAGISRVMGADTIYQLDMAIEPVILNFFEQWGREMPVVLVAEGIEAADGEAEGVAVFPRGTRAQDAVVRVICDPIDGTRGLMYDKRAAWFLCGAAPNRGLGDTVRTRLKDITAAVQVELPTAKQAACDVLWATKGGGARAVREIVRGDWFEPVGPVELRPSQAENIDHGFASVANFFPGAKELASRLMEEIAAACLGGGAIGQGVVFDDQYISTGGQLYELMVGHDRFVADLRPLFYRMRGMPGGMCVHPYDLASVLIAREAGVIVTDGMGGELDGPMDVTTSLAWAGYANAGLRRRIEGVISRFFGG